MNSFSSSAPKPSIMSTPRVSMALPARLDPHVAAVSLGDRPSAVLSPLLAHKASSPLAAAASSSNPSAPLSSPPSPLIVAQRSMPWQRGPSPGPNPAARPPKVTNPLPSATNPVVERWRAQQLEKGLLQQRAAAAAAQKPPGPAASRPQSSQPPPHQPPLQGGRVNSEDAEAEEEEEEEEERGRPSAAPYLPPSPPSPSPSAASLLRSRLGGGRSSTPFGRALEQMNAGPPAARAPGKEKGFAPLIGGEKPHSKKEWKKAVDWFVMESDELLSDRVYGEIAEECGMQDEWRPQVSLLVKLGFTKRDFQKLCDVREDIFQLGATNIKAKLLFLKDELSMSDAEIKATVLKFPRILEYRLTHTIQARLDFLQKTGLPKEDCKKVVMRAPSLLELSIDGTLKPRVDYLKRELSVKRDDLGKLISRSPQLLTYTEASIQARVDFLRGLGMSHAQVTTAVVKHPQVLHYRVNAMQKRIDFLAALGLTPEEICLVVSRFVQIFSLDVESNLGPKVRYLIEAMGFEPKTICACPTFLSLSLYGRIIPRHRFYKENLARNPTELQGALSYLQWTDEKFATKMGVQMDVYRAFAERVTASLAANAKNGQI